MPVSEPSPVHGWGWTLAAAAVGFVTSFVLSNVLRFPRPLFVAGYAVAVGAFFVAFARAQRLSVRRQVERRWVGGVVGGLLVGILLAQRVGLQPGSGRATGMSLLGDLAWHGVVYGTADALLLSILPVLALYGARPQAELQRAGGRLRWAAVAMLGSAVVTAAYHVGFAEFRGGELVQPLIGNALVTFAYLLTGSPVAALVSHVLMHAAAVMHGMSTTVQLPPHY